MPQRPRWHASSSRDRMPLKLGTIGSVVSSACSRAISSSAGRTFRCGELICRTTRVSRDSVGSSSCALDSPQLIDVYQRTTKRGSRGWQRRMSRPMRRRMAMWLRKRRTWRERNEVRAAPEQGLVQLVVGRLDAVHLEADAGDAGQVPAVFGAGRICRHGGGLGISVAVAGQQPALAGPGPGARISSRSAVRPERERHS